MQASDSSLIKMETLTRPLLLCSTNCFGLDQRANKRRKVNRQHIATFSIFHQGVASRLYRAPSRLSIWCLTVYKLSPPSSVRSRYERGFFSFRLASPHFTLSKQEDGSTAVTVFDALCVLSLIYFTVVHHVHLCIFKCCYSTHQVIRRSLAIPRNPIFPKSEVNHIIANVGRAGEVKRTLVT